MLRNNARSTLEALNLNLVDEVWLDEETGMPEVEACREVPDSLVAFNRARRMVQGRCPGYGVHFYIEDYMFNNIWRQPQRYENILSRFRCVISPDFSTYSDMPEPMVRWQVYRRRMLSQWMQRAGIEVIYDVQTMAPGYDDDQFCGVGAGGTVAVRPPLGGPWNRQGMTEFYRILEAVRERLAPETVLVYGKKLTLPTGLNYKFYDNDNIRIRRALAGRKREVLA